MERRTLVLTSWYMPIQIINWRDAIVDLYQNKVESIIDYDEVVRSPSVEMKLPAVVRIRRKTKLVRPKVKFSRVNIIARDRSRCQYCGKQKPSNELTFDHVIPRKRGGKTCWENIVSACRPCNMKKGCKTPDESGMFPLTLPIQPKYLSICSPIRNTHDIPIEWQAFVQYAI